MRNDEYSTINDIRDNPLAIESVVKAAPKITNLAERIYEKIRDLKRIFFVGCGSSYYAVMFGAWPLLNTELKVHAVPSSEFIFYHSQLLNEEDLVIGVSRSGQTAETVSAIKKAREHKALTVAFTLTPKSELYEISEESFAVDIGEEKSVVMTKSFTSLSLASAIFSAALKRCMFNETCSFVDELGELRGSAESLIKKEKEIQELAEARIMNAVERFICLGSGPAYPIMLEGALKIKETSYVATESFHTLEFRHGPMASIGEKLTIFLSAFKGEIFDASKRLLNEIKERGADVIFMTNSSEEGEEKGKIVIPRIECEENAALLSIIPIQIFAYYYAVRKGKNPDKPRGITRYIGKF